MFKGYLVSKNIVDTELLVDMPKNDVRMYLERYYYDFKDYITNEFLEVEMVDPEFYEAHKDDDPDSPLVESPEENDNVEYIKEYPFQDNLDKVPVEEEQQVFHETQEVKNKEETQYEFFIRKFNELFSLDDDEAINILSDTDGSIISNGFLFSILVREQLLGTFKGYLVSKNIVDAELIIDMPKNDVRMYLERYYYDFKDYITNGFAFSRQVREQLLDTFKRYLGIL